MGVCPSLYRRVPNAIAKSNTSENSLIRKLRKILQKLFMLLLIHFPDNNSNVLFIQL
jgi:branched-subunit amino acid transport protein AzlD